MGSEFNSVNTRGTDKSVEQPGHLQVSQAKILAWPSPARNKKLSIFLKENRNGIYNLLVVKQ